MSKDRLKVNIVMLPTEKSNEIGSIVINEDGTRLATINVLTTDWPGISINQHIYVTVSRLIKKGEPIIGIDNKLWFAPVDGTYQAIIASTNKSLVADYDVKPIRDSFVKIFIDKFNAGYKIIKAEIETEEIEEYVYPQGKERTNFSKHKIQMIKVREDNTIIFRKIEEKIFIKMDICKAYNDGRQNMIDVKLDGEDAFISSDDYFDKEFNS